MKPWMNYTRLMQPLRYKNHEAELAQMGRSAFSRDYDKVVFSPSFRRLGNKTQVHPHDPSMPLGHIHNRLTHSLEVASLGRTLGLVVGEHLRSYVDANVNPLHVSEVLQSACLAHDIGNPPFGHSGEALIQRFFQENQHILSPIDEQHWGDFLFFDGNAQGLRFVTDVKFGRRLRLSYATLGALIKYPWTSTHDEAKTRHKFSFFSHAKASLLLVSHHLGLIPQHSEENHENFAFSRHPLVYLVEASDDICYGILDLEDGVSMGLVSADSINNHLSTLIGSTAPDKDDDGLARLSRLRGLAIQHSMHLVAQRFVALHQAIIQGEKVVFFEKEHPIKAARTYGETHVYDQAHHARMMTLCQAPFEAFLAWIFQLAYDCVKHGKHESFVRELAPLAGYMKIEADAHTPPVMVYAQALDVVCHLTDQEILHFGNARMGK